ncbi:MAG: SLBB domain-containing protein [Deltaproteobacteria bacterium]|nr:SLBB domain-containing protein [Deltaproteobacteria bacterium]
MSDRGNLAYIIRNADAKDVKNLEAGRVSALLSQTKPLKVDLQRLLDRGDMGANILLKARDMIYIPLMRSLDVGLSQIYVEGEVRNPGSYDFRPGITAMNACIMAGGFDTFAAPNRTRIIRKKEGGVEIIKINLNEVRDGEIPDVELQPGDRIHVPETWL